MGNSSSKYNAKDPDYDEKHGVLINKLGILDPEQLESKEKEELLNAYKEASLSYPETHTFTANDVSVLHKLFLGNIFEWAGEYRRVDISSENIRWCHAQFIESEMKRIDKQLTSLTPFTPDLSQTEILERIAQIHGELIIIHPFRDGNGRVVRLLTDLLLMQAEIEPMTKYSLYDDSFRQDYYQAIQEVWAKADYKKLIKLFADLISFPAK